jgi:hypothetical protein
VPTVKAGLFYNSENLVKNNLVISETKTPVNHDSRGFLIVLIYLLVKFVFKFFQHFRIV